MGVALRCARDKLRQRFKAAPPLLPPAQSNTLFYMAKQITGRLPARRP